MASLVPLFGVCLLLAAHAGAQRTPLRGAVELPDGSAWAGAEVTLLSRPVPCDERFGYADRVTAVADAKGRFLVELAEGRLYSVWATQDLGDGTYRASYAVEEVRGGQPLALVADGLPRPGVRIRIAGLGSWDGRGAVECRLLTLTRNREVLPIPLDGKGDALLPPVPGLRADVEVLCGGLALWEWPREVDLREPSHDLAAPSPRPVRLRFVDRTNGKPIAGLRFLRGTSDPFERQRSLDCELGTTDSKGEVVVTLPLRAVTSVGSATPRPRWRTATPPARGSRSSTCPRSTAAPRTRRSTPSA